MSSERVRLGIVGCGMATLVMYSPVLRHVAAAEVTALCDPDPAALGRVGAYFPRAESYQDDEELLRKAPIDAVLVATPVNMHRTQVVRAVQAGKHVMCEKPMARTVAECDEMIAAARAAGVTLMIGFMKRFDKGMRHAKGLIEQGSLGTLHHLACDWRGQEPDRTRPTSSQALRDRAYSWRARAATWGGVYQDRASHTTDLARWWLGDVTAVSGEIAILRPDQEVEDSALGVYVHAGGATSVHNLSYSNTLAHETYLIDGSKASLEMAFGPSSYSSTDPFRVTLFEPGGRSVDETRYNHLVLDEELRASGRYKAELDHFCACVLTGNPPLTSGEDGRKTVEAITAVYLSAFLGEKIKLPLEKTPDFEHLFAEIKSRSPRAGELLAAELPVR